MAVELKEMDELAEDRRLYVVHVTKSEQAVLFCHFELVEPDHQSESLEETPDHLVEYF